MLDVLNVRSSSRICPVVDSGWAGVVPAWLRDEASMVFRRPAGVRFFLELSSTLEVRGREEELVILAAYWAVTWCFVRTRGSNRRSRILSDEAYSTVASLVRGV